VADISILDPAVHAAPKSYMIHGAQEIVLKGVTATLDGTGAAGTWVPALQVVDPSGFVVGTYTCGTVLAAGASADVSWFPGVSVSAHGGSVTATFTSYVPFDGPDTNGNGYLALTASQGFANVRRVVPAFRSGLFGTWEGSIPVPSNYISGGQITTSFVANATTGVLRHRVGTAVVAAGVSEDTAYTQEAYVNVTVPGTALRRFDTTFVLSTLPALGSNINVQVTRDGANVADTLAVSALMWETIFEYVGN
jgi:hypothetical protein